MKPAVLQETKILPAGENLTVEVFVSDEPEEGAGRIQIRGRCTFQPQLMPNFSKPFLAHVQRQALFELREALNAEIERL